VAGSGGSDSEGDDTSLMARDGEERDDGLLLLRRVY
jgi:hypothetical protein